VIKKLIARQLKMHFLSVLLHTRSVNTILPYAGLPATRSEISGPNF